MRQLGLPIGSNATMDGVCAPLLRAHLGAAYEAHKAGGYLETPELIQVAKGGEWRTKGCKVRCKVSDTQELCVSTYALVGVLDALAEQQHGGMLSEAKMACPWQHGCLIARRVLETYTCTMADAALLCMATRASSSFVILIHDLA